MGEYREAARRVAETVPDAEARGMLQGDLETIG